MVSRQQIREALEAPKQALTLALIALGVAALALLMAFGAMSAGKAA